MRKRSRTSPGGRLAELRARAVRFVRGEADERQSGRAERHGRSAVAPLFCVAHDGDRFGRERPELTGVSERAVEDRP